MVDDQQQPPAMFRAEVIFHRVYQTACSEIQASLGALGILLQLELLLFRCQFAKISAPVHLSSCAPACDSSTTVATSASSAMVCRSNICRGVIWIPASRAWVIT